MSTTTQETINNYNNNNDNNNNNNYNNNNNNNNNNNSELESDYLDITGELFSSAKKLSIGEFVCNKKKFTLNNAMSALELVNTNNKTTNNKAKQHTHREDLA